MCESGRQQSHHGDLEGDLSDETALMDTTSSFVVTPQRRSLVPKRVVVDREAKVVHMTREIFTRAQSAPRSPDAMLPLLI